ncbi:hypothetical protein ACOSP7_011803 [Xanthoceras sorbifolium]
MDMAGVFHNVVAHPIVDEVEVAVVILKVDMAEVNQMFNVFNVEKFGHYSSECTNKHENYANLAEASDDIIEEPTLLIVHNDSVEKNNVWYLDSGASNHMCGRKEYFVNLKEEIGGSVSLGDGSKLQVAGRGQIQIYQKDGKIRDNGI